MTRKSREVALGVHLCNDKQRIWEKYLQGEGTDNANLLKQTSDRVFQGLVCEDRPAEKERRGRGETSRESEAGLHKESSEGNEPRGTNKAELELTNPTKRFDSALKRGLFCHPKA